VQDATLFWTTKAAAAAPSPYQRSRGSTRSLLLCMCLGAPEIALPSTTFAVCCTSSKSYWIETPMALRN